MSPRRRGDPFVCHTIGNTQKVTAVGTKRPWLAFRRSQDKLARLWRTQTVSCSAPDASPSLRSLSQGGFLTALIYIPQEPQRLIFLPTFFHRRKKVGPHRRGDSFVSHTIGNTQKVTAVGTKLPWLAFRRTGSKRACSWRMQATSLAIHHLATGRYQAIRMA